MTEEANQSSVAFQTPMWCKFCVWFYTVVFGVVIAVVLLVIIAEVPMPLWGRIAAWLCVGVVPAAAVAILNRYATSFYLHDDHLRVKRLVSSAEVHYDEIRFFKLDMTEIMVIPRIFSREIAAVRIKRRHGKDIRILLSVDDAQTLMEAMRELCPQMSALAFDDQAYVPTDDGCEDAYVVLAAALGRKSITTLLGVMMFGAAFLFAPWTITTGSKWLLVGAVATLIVAVLLSRLYIRQRRLRREILDMIEMQRLAAAVQAGDGVD